MSRATVERRSRWVSLGAWAMPSLPFLPDHEDPVELDDRLASLVEPARPQPHEAEPRPTPGFPDLRDFRLRVQRVAVEDRSGEPYVLHANLEPVAARRVDEEPCGNRDGQEAVHDPPPVERCPREGSAGVILVEVDLVRIPGQQGEPHVVRLRDGPSDLAPDLRPDPEVLEKRPVLVHGDPAERDRRAVLKIAADEDNPSCARMAKRYSSIGRFTLRVLPWGKSALSQAPSNVGRNPHARSSEPPSGSDGAMCSRSTRTSRRYRSRRRLRWRQARWERHPHHPHDGRPVVHVDERACDPVVARALSRGIRVERDGHRNDLPWGARGRPPHERHSPGEIRGECDRGQTARRTAAPEAGAPRGLADRPSDPGTGGSVRPRLCRVAAEL